jgi:hypothetical protein
VDFGLSLRSSSTNRKRFVWGKPVPDQQHRRFELPAQLVEESDHMRRFKIDVGMETKEQTNMISLGRDAQCGNGRDLLVASGSLMEDRCLAPRSPGSSHQRCHQKTALVGKSNSRFQPVGFFLTPGHSFCTQDRMAFSSRSMALRSGFWGENPKALRMRQVWEMW